MVKIRFTFMFIMQYDVFSCQFFKQKRDKLSCILFVSISLFITIYNYCKHLLSLKHYLLTEIEAHIPAAVQWFRLLYNMKLSILAKLIREREMHICRTQSFKIGSLSECLSY